jgi:hypothetical protein
MGDSKSCLFCGKRVDRTFEYCPHCGYEFSEGDELLPPLPETAADASAVPPDDADYLVRLRTLQEILSDMERELDLIITRTASGDP